MYLASCKSKSPYQQKTRYTNPTSNKTENFKQPTPHHTPHQPYSIWQNSQTRQKAPQVSSFFLNSYEAELFTPFPPKKGGKRGWFPETKKKNSKKNSIDPKPS